MIRYFAFLIFCVFIYSVLPRRTVVLKRVTLPPLISIYIHSGPDMFKGRRLQRQNCFPMYKRHNIKARFVVARPSFDTRAHHAHAQGQLGTKKEHEVSEALFNESSHYKDILLLQHRDYYRDMTDKMLAYMRYDYEHVKSRFLFKTDDEYCLHIPTAMEIIKQKAEKEMYVGTHLFKGTEYAIMKGPHGEIAPFMSGAVLGVSRGILKSIIKNWDYSAMYHIYGTSSDDANLGKWILHDKKLEVDYIVNGKIKVEHSKRV